MWVITEHFKISKRKKKRSVLKCFNFCHYLQGVTSWIPRNSVRLFSQNNAIDDMWRIQAVTYTNSVTALAVWWWITTGLPMMLGSFQCRGVLLQKLAYSRARACCACSRCGKGGLYFFLNFHLSSLSNVLSFGRRLNMTEILWFRLLIPNGSCQLLLRMSSLSTG